MTARQREVLGLIRRRTLADGYPPTILELGAYLGINSTQGVHDHLRSLARQGLLTWLPRSARTLRLTPAGEAALGRVS